MGFGFASAGRLVSAGLGINGIKRAPETVGTRLGGSCVYTAPGSHPQSPSWVRWLYPTIGSGPTHIHLTTGCSETAIARCRNVAWTPHGTGSRPAPTQPPSRPTGLLRIIYNLIIC